MVTETPFFILGLPRTRTAWLSVVVSMCGRLCFHEGMRDFVSFEDYAQNREATGDADPTLIYWTARLLEEWPEARFVVIYRDPEESLNDLIAASPPELAEGLRAGWGSSWQAFASTRDVLRGNPRALFVDFEQLQEAAVVADIVEHCGGERPSALAVERWQRLHVNTHLVNPKELVQPVLSIAPSSRVMARDVCDVSGLSACLYEPRSFEMIAEWWRAHSEEVLLEAALPPLGVVVSIGDKPAAAIWCYECYGVPVAELAFPVTRPGLGLKDARRVMLYAISCLIGAAGKGHEPEADFRVFKALSPPGLTRFLERLGFQRALFDKQPMTLTL
jgi:hypothetical protein